MRASGQYVHFAMFKGMLKSWDTLFTEAADFAQTLEPAQLISISHSADQSSGVITVWYWSREPRGE